MGKWLGLGASMHGSSTLTYPPSEIRNKGIIFFRWVVQPPTRKHEKSLEMCLADGVNKNAGDGDGEDRNIDAFVDT